ncbi:MAG TPA: AAA family ATPase [Acidimicrobiales bacterium]|nr:AAA family ATPase [Acidimicrobiales bacterium]
MEPLDYLKILQRHWKMAATLVVTVIVAVLVLAPAKPSTVYEAKHILLRSSTTPEATAAADNPQVVALWSSGGKVPQNVAETLGHTGPADELINRLTVTPNIELGTVDMVATGSTDDEAVLLVNTFADETLKYIDQLNQEAQTASQEQIDELQTEIDELNQRITDAGGETAPGAASLVSQRQSKLDEQNQLSTEARANVTEWDSLQTAATAKKVAASSVGVSRAQALLLGGLVAFLLAFGVAIMLDRSDSRLHTKEQAERQFGLPVLAEVPLLSIRNRHRAAVFGYEHDAGLAEAYRSLRTALLLFRDRLPFEVETADLTRRSQHIHSGRGSNARQVILVTSPEAGDGKSTTAANLAMAYAESGQSVLLVNWDLWRPTPARVFDAEESPGVSEFLEARNASLVNYVHSTSVPGLHLVPAGKLGHQPGGQLDAELRLLEEARSLADVVIIDTAPLLAASVTRELVTMADVVVLASRVGRTTSPAAERTAELLERLGAPTLGVVLVGVPSGLFKTDYYTKSQSRTDRLRASVRGRESGGRYTAGRGERAAEATPADDEEYDSEASATDTGPESLPSRGTKP